MSELKQGVVKFFNDSKGYGFIIPEDGSPDIFVYRRDINKNSIGLRTLSDNQDVELTPNYRVGQNKWKANGISIIEHLSILK